MKIVIDTLGGDKGAGEIIKAIKKFKKDFKDVELIAVGNEEELSVIKDIAKIVPSKTIVKMEAGALEAMRDKESSMYIAVDTLLSENADAIISSGSTGAFLSLAALKIKKIDGVLRPALITAFPTLIKDKSVVLLDVGASNENSAEELVQFAKMGSLYSNIVFNVENPKISLISNGAEKGKGSPITKEAYKMLEEDENFLGNIEARDILKGTTDVVVFDGFTGNIFLKGSEGMAKTMTSLLKDAFKKNLLTKIGYLFSKSGIKELKDKMDYKKVGGALLIGVNSVVVKAHGNSDSEAFYSALKVTYGLTKKDVVKKIKERFNV